MKLTMGLIKADIIAASQADVGFSIRIDTLKRALKEANAWYDKLYGEGIR